MRVLVTGAAGLLGGRLAELLARRFDVVGARHDSTLPVDLPSVTLDVRQRDSVERAFDTAKPDAVLHAAALANASECERDPARAHAINVDGSRWVAEACARRNVRLVALSTDLVFAGDRASSDEETPVGPLMTYGRTKWDGEEVALGTCAGAVIARVTLLSGRGFGRRGSSTEEIAWALRERRALTLFTDEYRTPVDAESLVVALGALLTGTQTGRFHLGGPERISRYELGLRVARVLGLDPAPIEGVRQAERAGPPRPADVSLDSGRARRLLGFSPRPLDEVIRDGRLARSA
jgi:dTDP-4-dehydrorhamnose reductase